VGQLQGSVIRRLTPVFMLLASGSLALVAAAERTLTFPLPDSIVLFDSYNDGRSDIHTMRTADRRQCSPKTPLPHTSAARSFQ
jgi:hypothetical protein